MPSELAQYKTLAAQTLIEAGKTAQMRTSRTSNLLTSVGLSEAAKFTATAGEVTIPEITESTTVKGLPRESFTAEALAQFDAEALTKFRKCLYAEIRYAVDAGDLPTDVALDALTKLGLPTPNTVTVVEADITGLGTTRFTLPGKANRADVEAALAPHAKDPAGDAVRAAFPQATGLRKPVRQLYLNSKSDWVEDYDGQPVTPA